MLRALQYHSSFRSFRAGVGHIAGRTKEFQFPISPVHGARLDSLATSSTRDTYLRELEMAGMVDNPECPYDRVSVDERLNMLRERERRWKNLDWVWKATLATPPIISQPSYARGGAMYINKENAKEDIVGLHSACLPSKATDDVNWTEIDLGKTIWVSTLAIEEHDLLVCLTSTPQVVESGRPYILIQVHFIQHSTRLPHPLASTPILDVCTLKGKDGPPKLNAAVSGENLALVISSEYHWEGDLSVWNWRTGVKKGEAHVPEPRLGLFFLREDILLNGNLTDMSLDVYRISETNSCSGVEMEGNKNGINHVRLIHSFCLPQIKEDEYETIEISFPSQPSFPLTSPQKTNLPFTSNPLSAVLLIEVIIRTDLFREPWRTFTFIAHCHTLLDLILEAVDSPNQDSSKVSRVPWDAWGPHTTRMLADDSTEDICHTASTGTRCIWLHGPQLEVLDFGCYNLKTALQTTVRRGGPVHLVDFESIYPISAGPFTKDVLTNLPYISSRSLVGLENPWEGVFMDDERIVGFTRKALHILHLQP